MGEAGIVRLIQAFVFSHVAYAVASHNWYREECNKIDTLIRQVCRQTLGISEYASKELLLQLGVSNTLEEIADA